MCVMVPAEIVRAALQMPVSRELWAMIDAHQRRDLIRAGLLEAPSTADSPLTLVAPLSPEQADAADRADLARTETETTIRELHRHPAPRALNCGTYSPTIHIRRERGGGKVEDALFRTSCGRSDCPHCWRRRLTQTYRRACNCLLDAPGLGRLPRTGHVHVAETTWREWESLDKAIRRQHPEARDEKGRCNLGRLRLRRADNTVLVVCERPFRGSRPLSPADALKLTIGAVGQLHTARHAYRQLGSWNDSEESAWRQVAVYARQLDFAEVRRRLEEASTKSRLFKAPDLAALVWRSESETAALRLELLVQAMALGGDGGLSDFSRGKNCSPSRPNSDIRQDEGEIEGDDGEMGGRWPTPFDDDRREGTDK